MTLTVGLSDDGHNQNRGDPGPGRVPTPSFAPSHGCHTQTLFLTPPRAYFSDAMTMIRLVSALPLIALLLVALLPPAPARAACTDVAEPGVEWRRCYHDGRNLEGADLSGAVLRDTSFQRANLKGANLSGINGFRTRFVSADLRGADLSNADLSEADFTKADLSGAILKNTDLRRARFFRATLRGADLTGADLEMADLLHADLSGATWVNGQRVCADESIGQCN